MKERLDLLLVERRLVESKKKATWLIKNGFVRVNGKKVDDPAILIDNIKQIELRQSFPYINQEGIRIEYAIKKLGICISGRIAVDIGSREGGFSDFLLKEGCQKIYVFDNVTALLHPSLRCKDEIIKEFGFDFKKEIQVNDQVDIIIINMQSLSLEELSRNRFKFLKMSGDMILCTDPSNFKEDKSNLQKLNHWINSIGLKVIDTINMKDDENKDQLFIFIHLKKENDSDSHENAKKLQRFI